MAHRRPAAMTDLPPAPPVAASPAARLAGTLMVVGAASSWGTWSLFLRPSGLPATFTAPLMFFIMGLACLPFALRAPSVAWDRRAVWLLLGNGACDALNVLTFFAAMDRTSVAIAVLTHYATPVLVALAAPYIDREKNPAALAAALLALVGLALILEPWNSAGGGASGAGWGAVLGLASACCYTGNVFIVRRLADRVGVARAMSYHSLLAACFLAPMLTTVSASAVTGAGLAYLLAGSLTVGAAAGMLYVAGLTRIGASRSGVLTFAEPLVAVVVGIAVWNEPATVAMLAGGALVLVAGAWVIRGAASTTAAPTTPAVTPTASPPSP